MRNPFFNTSAMKRMCAIQLYHLPLLELLQTDGAGVTHVICELRLTELLLGASYEWLIAGVHSLQYVVYPFLQIIIGCPHHPLLLSPLAAFVTQKDSEKESDKCQKSDFKVQVRKHAADLQFLRRNIIIFTNTFKETVRHHLHHAATVPLIRIEGNIVIATNLSTSQLRGRCLLDRVDPVNFIGDVHALLDDDVDQR